MGIAYPPEWLLVTFIVMANMFRAFVDVDQSENTDATDHTSPL